MIPEQTGTEPQGIQTEVPHPEETRSEGVTMPNEESLRDSVLKQEFVMQFAAKLMRGICYVKNINIDKLPKGLREIANSAPVPKDWALTIYRLLGETTFKRLNPQIAEKESYCYTMGFTGGMCLSMYLSFHWMNLTEEEQKPLIALAQPTLDALPETTDEQAEKFGLALWEALKKKYFNNAIQTIENLAALFTGIGDGMLAVPLRGESMQYDSNSTRVYFMLLLFEPQVEKMGSVAEIHELIKEIYQLKSLVPDLDTFKKLCQRIGLQGQRYKSMDTPIEPVP